MESKDLTKEQLIDKIKSLQETINSLENTVLVQGKTEDALKTSEENLSAILEHNADGIIIVDIKGIVLYVNPAAENLFGRSKKDFLGYEFGFPVSADNKLDTLTMRIGNSLIEVELRIVQINFQFQPAYQLSIRDITERKLAEKALKESEEKCKVIFDNANDGMFLVDLETRKFFMCNRSSAQMLGYQLEEFPNLEIADIHPKDDLPFIFEQIEMHINGGKSARSDVGFKRKNDDIFISDLSSNIIRITGKNYLLVIFRDITERKQMEDSLRESEEKIRSILENSADAIFITDQNGRYTYTNKAVTTMLGFTKEDMMSKTIVDLAPKSRMNEYLELFNRLMTEGKVFSEFELLKNDGSYIYTDLNAVILPNGTTYGSCRDITKRKLTELELINAKEKAEESDRLKTSFLTNMSHEIRTPMNGILGFAELLKEPNLTSDDLQDYIQIIQISGARMLNTINNIVDISKLESGLIQVDIKETNINEKIEFTYNFFKPEAEIKKLHFSYKNSLQSKDSIIKTDNEKVYGILTNLVKNAIKFTYEGSIELGYEKKGEYLEFFVKDTGIGILQNQKELIFERFRQGSESHNRGYEGSGLGLSIAKSYVEMLGGKIWVESEEGKGSAFYFTVPYNAVSEEKTVIENTFSEKDKEVHFNKIKILIVEDDEISYSLLARTLQTISCEILHAITGIEAVETCRINPGLDLILMDIRMPGMDGNEATQQIRQFNKDVIIIAQTAYAFSGDKEKAIEAGCNSYITKPINRTLLTELVKSYFNK